MTTAISFDQVSFAYPDGAQVLSGVTGEVPAGSFALLVGATGSGKTTLLRNVKVATAPTGTLGGTIKVYGEDLRQADSQLAAAAVGYVAQNPDNQLVCHTVWHELAFGLENTGVPGPEMRRRVAEVAHFFGMEPWFQQEVQHLSGGQKQMLNLASVLVMQPRILLLDEPTAQLDPVAQRTFCHALFRLNRELGLTLVVATHQPHLFAGYATHALTLDEDGLRPCSLEAFRERPLQGEELTLAATLGLVGRDVESLAKAPVACRAQDVFVRYGRGDDFVLRNLDLEVRQGHIHALVGGNGSGKSTVLKTLAGNLKPARGKLYNGLRAQQAYAPQDPKALFVTDSVWEELQEWSATCGYGDQDIRWWLEQTGLAGHERQHPYDLSGGQQQLLAFAKLALTKPGLLMLDEPAKGLDASCKLLLACQLRECARRGTTVVLATHDLAFAACVAQEVSLLFDGQVTSTEPPADFFRANVFYRPMADAFTEAWLGQELPGA